MQRVLTFYWNGSSNNQPVPAQSATLARPKSMNDHAREKAGFAEPVITRGYALW